MQTIVVTRHKALVQYLVEIGLIEEGTPVLEHATVEQVKGKHVVGVLPLSLARHAFAVTEVPLALSAEDRGKELGIGRLREIAGDPVTYMVEVVPAWSIL